MTQRTRFSNRRGRGGIGPPIRVAPPAMADAAASTGVKFNLVQALRGFAATWVMFHHAFWGRHIDHLYHALPTALAHFLFLWGFMGVEIFFVLSGFIIAHSVRGATVTGAYFRQFAIRRSLRLDPAYWCAIAFAIAMAALSARATHRPHTLPSTTDVISHLTYTQMFFGYPYSISGVFWTLTYEIQFYLVFILALLIQRRLVAHIDSRAATILVFGPLYIVAWVWGVVVAGDNAQGFFWINWYGFFCGVLGYWAATDREVRLPFFALAGGLLLFGRDIGQVCAITALLLHATLRRGSIVWLLSFAPLQFLGTISYSLYLTHTQVQGAAMNILYRVIPRTPIGEAAALTISSITCVAVAAIFWWSIERPSHRLAKRYGRMGKAASSHQ